MKQTCISRLGRSQNLGMLCDFLPTQLKISPYEKFEFSGKGGREGTISGSEI